MVVISFMLSVVLGAVAGSVPTALPAPASTPTVAASPLPTPAATGDPLAPTPPPVRVPIVAGPTPAALDDGGPTFDTALRYILSRASATLHASEVRAGSSPHTRYRIDYASAYAFAPGSHCNLGVANTFVEAFTDTNDAVRGLDPPQLYAIDDGAGHNVYSAAFTQGVYARRELASRQNGASRTTYTWNYAFVYRFNGVDLSRLRLVTITDLEKREMFEPFVFTDRETGQRVLRAVTRAATLCGAHTSDPFAPASVPDPFATPP